jgi:hypothetical protein
MELYIFRLAVGKCSLNTVLLTARLSAMFRHATWSRNPQGTKALEKFQYWFAAAFLDMEIKQRLESRGAEPGALSRFSPAAILRMSCGWHWLWQMGMRMHALIHQNCTAANLGLPA